MQYYTIIDSPIDPLLLVADGTHLTGLWMSKNRCQLPIRSEWVHDPQAEPLAQAAAQLDAYFQGWLQIFDLPLAPAGSDFQRRVWAELARIPYGSRISYKTLAGQIGQPGGVRAVGAANGRNPISIILPCHRVIGADGSLTGYGGGLARKAALLDFEAAVLASGPQPFPSMERYAQPLQPRLWE